MTSRGLGDLGWSDKAISSANLATSPHQGVVAHQMNDDMTVRTSCLFCELLPSDHVLLLVLDELDRGRIQRPLQLRQIDVYNTRRSQLDT
jgi:hypothetical protein